MKCGTRNADCGLGDKNRSGRAIQSLKSTVSHLSPLDTAMPPGRPRIVLRCRLTMGHLRQAYGATTWAGVVLRPSSDGSLPACSSSSCSRQIAE